MPRWPLLPLLLLGCSSETIAPPGPPMMAADAGGPPFLPDGGATSDDAGGTVPPVCAPNARWDGVTPIFEEVTQAWGLDAIGATGTRLSAGDFDQDGWIDVLIRAANNAGDDFAGPRRSWLLINDRRGGFEDRTQSSGLWQTRGAQTLGRPGQVTAFADVDNDGDLDVYTGMQTRVDGAMPGEGSELMLNDGSGNFSLGPEASELRRALEVDAVAGAAFTDFNRDGAIDLWIGQHNTTPAGTQSTVFLGDNLYQGDGAGGFVEVTAIAGLTTTDWVRIDDLNQARSHSRAWSAAACDLNDDGTPELLVASYGRAPNHLWQGRRDGDGTVRYENRSVASGYAYDQNLEWSDNEFARCYCQANRGAEGCAGVAAPRIACGTINWNHANDREPFRLGGNSGATVCADINNDGRLDLLTTEITHWWAGSGADRSELLLNTGEAEVRFSRPGLTTMGLERGNPAANWDNGDMSAAVFDFDNDGWPDVYIGSSDYPGTRGLLFHQQQSGVFAAVPPEQGVDHRRSHGVLAADFDRDGDLDLMVGHSLARCGGADECYPTGQVRLFENKIGHSGNWLQLDLVGGPGTNRAAIGARVTVRAGEVTQTQEIDGGHGHYGAQRDRILHFGLGAACEAEVTIRWPDAALTLQTLRVEGGHRYRVVQGQAAILADR